MTRLLPAAATPMTAASVSGSRRSVGRSMSTPYPDRGRTPARRRWPRSPAQFERSPTARSCCSTGWSPRPRPRCSCPRRPGCGWSCSCTCRWVCAPCEEADGTRSRERAVLSAAAAVVTTSAWTRDRLLELYRLPAERLDVARPAVDAADPVTGTAAGGELLCVAAVTLDKGHDLLLGALTAIADLSWQCTCVGSLDRDPMFAQDIRVHSRSAAPFGSGCASPGRGPGPIWTAATPPPTCSCWPRAPRPTGWS